MLRVMLGALFVIGAALTVVSSVALFKKLFRGKGSITLLGIKIEGQGAPIIFLLVGAGLLVVALRSAEAADARHERDLRLGVEQELEETRAAETPVYAGEEFQSAVQAATDLNRELETQRKTFVFLRSYQPAEQLAQVAKTTSVTARTTTVARKEEAKAAASEAIDATKAALATGRVDLSPGQLASLRQSLATAEVALQAGRFLDAKRGAKQARELLPADLRDSRFLADRASRVPAGESR